MPLHPRSIQDENEYKEFVERYRYLVDGELKHAESLRGQDKHHELALLLPNLISIVNVAGYLRGQDNCFIELRPDVSFQSDLYGMEGAFENRLGALIDFVKSTGSATFLSDRVQEYYLQQRGLGK